LLVSFVCTESDDDEDCSLAAAFPTHECVLHTGLSVTSVLGYVYAMIEYYANSDWHRGQ